MSTWWDDFKQSFLKGVNPVDSISNQVSYHSQQIPGPQIPTPPTPERWYNNAAAHPLFPQPQGAPSDFSGQVMPNPNNLRALSDTQVPTDAMNNGQMSTENFRGPIPLRRLLSGGGGTIKVR